MKLRNKKTGEVKAVNHAKILVHFSDGTTDAFNSLKELTDKYSDCTDPLIKDEKVRKAVRAWAEVLGVNEVEFYGSETWIGFRTKLIGYEWSSKFELDYSGSKKYTNCVQNLHHRRALRRGGK